MGKQLTEDEIVETIKHSNDLIILVEGQDDIRIYRWILEHLNKEDCIISTGGCGVLRSVFKRKDEFADKKVIFITDRDTYVYDTIPAEYNGIVFTEGYSIENDLYCGKQLYKKFLEKEDRNLLDKALDSFLLYYAYEYDKYKRGEIYNFREKPEKILDHRTYNLNSCLYPTKPEPKEESIKYLKDNYDLLLRGHSLFKLIGMILRRDKREPKYADNSIYEICYKCYKSEKIKSLTRNIEEAIKQV